MIEIIYFCICTMYRFFWVWVINDIGISLHICVLIFCPINPDRDKENEEAVWTYLSNTYRFRDHFGFEIENLRYFQYRFDIGIETNTFGILIFLLVLKLTSASFWYWFWNSFCWVLVLGLVSKLASDGFWYGYWFWKF